LKPKLSYTIWFSQRTGSTLLCKALESTGVAGKPNEWLYAPDAKDFLEYFGVKNYEELQKHLWELGSTPNGICGVKFSFYQPYFSKILELFSNFPDSPKRGCSRAEIWNHAFPNSQHIFMTRRNKVRLAVSWWKAIKTQEWRRDAYQVPTVVDLTNAYSFEAINHLLCECTLREAGIQEFFSETNIVPLSIFYEDFINEYDRTVKTVLNFLEIDSSPLDITPPHYVRLADEISEIWVERFRNELQKNWQNQGW
jgi:trehalose 2-sulfotransferase